MAKRISTKSYQKFEGSHEKKKTTYYVDMEHRSTGKKSIPKRTLAEAERDAEFYEMHGIKVHGIRKVVK